jgi:hypothetical protein
VVVPRGAVHQPSNPGTLPTRVLLVFSPTGMDRFFEEAVEEQMPLQAVPSDPVRLEKLRVFTEKYGYEFAEFPPGLWGSCAVAESLHEGGQGGEASLLHA